MLSHEHLLGDNAAVHQESANARCGIRQGRHSNGRRNFAIGLQSGVENAEFECERDTSDRPQFRCAASNDAKDPRVFLRFRQLRGWLCRPGANPRMCHQRNLSERPTGSSTNPKSKVVIASVLRHVHQLLERRASWNAFVRTEQSRRGFFPSGTACYSPPLDSSVTRFDQYLD